MENQKGSVLVVVVITILSIAVAGLGGFVVYDKVIDKKESKVEEKTANNESDTNETNEQTTEKNKSENTDKIVDNVEYNILTNKIYKKLIGKYVSMKNEKTYLVIDEKGQVSLSINYCYGLSQYNNDDIDIKFYYEDMSDINGTPEDIRATIVVLPKDGSSNYFDPFSMSGGFDSNGELVSFAGDYNFQSLQYLGCENTQTQFKKQ